MKIKFIVDLEWNSLQTLVYAVTSFLGGGSRPADLSFLVSFGRAPKKAKSRVAVRMCHRLVDGLTTRRTLDVAPQSRFLTPAEFNK